MIADPSAPLLRQTKVYVNQMGFDLRDGGAQHLGVIQTYADRTLATDFTAQFNVILKAIETWGAATTRHLHLGDAATEPLPAAFTAVTDDLIAQGKSLGNAIRDFNRSSWWQAPSTVRVLIAVPFQVAGYVIARVGMLVEQTGDNLLGGLDFFSRHATVLILAAVVAYIAAPLLVAKLSRS